MPDWCQTTLSRFAINCKRGSKTNNPDVLKGSIRPLAEASAGTSSTKCSSASLPKSSAIRGLWRATPRLVDLPRGIGTFDLECEAEKAEEVAQNFGAALPPVERLEFLRALAAVLGVSFDEIGRRCRAEIAHPHVGVLGKLGVVGDVSIGLEKVLPFGIEFSSYLSWVAERNIAAARFIHRRCLSVQLPILSSTRYRSGQPVFL
jgi:hypothetical protein